MLTRHLLDVGAEVTAVDPSPPFVEAASAALPDVEVARGTAEDLPWADGSFAAALSQLVLMFMSDPDAALAEMIRVVTPGGTVAAATWDYPRMGMLATFWGAVHDVIPSQGGEGAALPFGTVETLAEQWTRSGLDEVHTDILEVSETYADAEDCWRPLTYGVGPAGDFARSLDAGDLARVREAFVARIGGESSPFTLTAFAPVVRGTRS